MVFVPGMKGCHLHQRNSQGKEQSAWIQLRHAFSTPIDLTLGAAADLRVRGLVRKIALIPFLWERDIYESWAQFLAILPREVYFFTYDWRQSPRESADELLAFCKKIVQEGGQAVTMIGHSLGGLLARRTLLQSPHLFAQVIYAGVPFAGNIGLLPDLHQGISVGFNRHILRPQVLSSFPSTFSFFPLENQHLLDEEGEALPLDFFNAEDWSKYQLGPAVLSTVLEEAKLFRQELLLERKVKVPQTILQASKQSTLAKWKKKKGQWEKIYGQGDGRFLAEDQLAVAGEKVVLSTHLPHADLLNSPSLWEQLLPQD